MRRKVGSAAALVFCWLLLACAAAVVSEEANAAAGGDWTANGPGAVSASPAEGPAGGMRFTYDYNDSAVWSGSDWTFSTTSTVTGAVYYKWSYSGLHAWFLATAKLTAFTTLPDNSVQSIALFDRGVSGDFSGSGTFVLPVYEGRPYGFKIYGENFDSNHFLRGTLLVTNDIEITPAVTGIMGNNGWYRSDVQLSWSANRPIVSHTGCDPAILSSDTIAATYTCTAVTPVGTGTGSITLKRDATPPAIAGTVVGGTYARGWYASPVSIAFECADAMSGVASCQSGIVVSEEGGNGRATGTAVDRAGNASAATVTGIRVDRTAPVTVDNAPAGALNRDVTVTLTGSDTLSGIYATYFKVDGSQPQSGNAILFTSEGTHRFTYWSEDVAGNVETPRSAAVVIDKTPPVTAARVSPDGNFLRLYAQDNMSVSLATYYRIDNGTDQVGADVPLGLTGMHTISYWSEDEAGNREQARVLSYLDTDGNGKVDIVDVVAAVNSKVDADGDGTFSREDVRLFVQSVTMFNRNGSF